MYTADSSRLPIRLENYIRAAENDGDLDMMGIADGNLLALGTSYINADKQSLVDKTYIAKPWRQYTAGWIQNFISAGLLAYAEDTRLSYKYRANVANSLKSKWGTKGVNGSIDSELASQDGFNSSLSLWALTVSKAGNTPLQQRAQNIRTGSATRDVTSVTFDYPTTNVRAGNRGSTAMTDTQLDMCVAQEPTRDGHYDGVSVLVTPSGRRSLQVYHVSGYSMRNHNGRVCRGNLLMPQVIVRPHDAGLPGEWTISIRGTSASPARIEIADLF